MEALKPLYKHINMYLHVYVTEIVMSTYIIQYLI